MTVNLYTNSQDHCIDSILMDQGIGANLRDYIKGMGVLINLLKCAKIFE